MNKICPKAITIPDYRQNQKKTAWFYNSSALSKGRYPKRKAPKVSTAMKYLLRQFILNLESTPIQILKHLIGIILLSDSLQPRETLSLTIQTQGLLPSTCIVEEDEGVVKTGCFGFRVDCGGEILEEGVDVGVVAGVGVV